MSKPTISEANDPLPVFRWAALTIAIVAFAMMFLPSGIYEAALARGSGQSARLIADRLPLLLLLTGLAASIATLVAWYFDKQVADGVAMISQSRLAAPAITPHQSTTKEYAWWGLVCVLVVLAFDWRSIIWGYFESDDFQFLIDNRTLEFPHLLFAVMNDHVFPLGRIAIRALHACFGANAIAYNCLAVGCLALLVWSGCLYLIQSGVSRLAVLLFVMLMVGWTMWGEFTSGEYILLLYESLMIATLFVGWATIRWRESNQLRYSLLVSLCVGYACFMSISGFYVACAAWVFFACEWLNPDSSQNSIHSRPSSPRAGFHCLAIAVPVVLASALYAYAYQSPSGPTFLSSAGERSGITGLTIQWCYTIATAILSIPLAIPHHLVDFGVMRIAITLSLVLFIAASTVAWPHLRRDALRARFISVILVLSGVTLMICLGRPTVGLGNVVPPKYLFMPYTLLCIALAMILDGWWCRSGPVSRPQLLKFCLASIAVIWSLQGMASFLGGCGMPFFETTRGGELRAHRLAYAATEELREVIFEPVEHETLGRLRIPDISGDALCGRYPGLRFPWGYEPPMSFMLDVLATNPGECQLLSTTPTAFPWIAATQNLREDVSPEFIEMLRQSAQLRTLYSLPEDLDATETHEPPDSLPPSFTLKNEMSPTKNAREITSDGSTQIRIQYPQWKPELRHQLKLAIEGPADGRDRPLTVSFSSDLFPEPVEYSLPTHPSVSLTQTIDLLQLPSFALSERIHSLAIHLDQPGIYNVRYCDVPKNHPNADHVPIILHSSALPR